MSIGYINPAILAGFFILICLRGAYVGFSGNKKGFSQKP
jgi:hypothetical protein